MLNYSNFLNEKLGVPEGNIESAKNIFDELITFIKSKGDNIIDKENFKPTTFGDSVGFKLKSIVKVGKLEFKNIHIYVNVVGILDYNDKVDKELEKEAKEGIVVTGLSVAIPHHKENATHVTFDKSTDDIDIALKIAISEDSTWVDLYKTLNNEKAGYIGTLSHEIKHIYDKHMIGKQMFGDIVSYGTWTNQRFGIQPIDDFIFYLYLISKTESLVRSSEVAGEIVASGITKPEFKNFLESVELYKRIQKMKSFSFKEMKSNLYNDVDNIRQKLKNSGIDSPKDNDELIDFILELTYQNIVGKKVEKLGRLMGINNPFKNILNLITDEEKDYYNKFLKKVTFNTKEEYFEYWEKMIKFEANKVLKKISKLYDMCVDTNTNKLQSKITDKSTDKSIINPVAHDKFVADKSIKNYESFSELIKKI